MKEPEILIVEDEPRIREILRSYLVSEGFAVDESGSGDNALEKVEEKDYSLIILDLMLPGVAGEKVAATVKRSSDTPILMLTAKGEEMEKLRGFELGADDYVVKPFSPKEVVARVKVILKRSGNLPANELPNLIAGDLVISPSSYKITLAGEEIKFTATEFDLLYELAGHPGHVYKRSRIASLVLGYDYKSYERTVDTHIKNIRKKMKNYGKMIETVFGVGYRFKDGQL